MSNKGVRNMDLRVKKTLISIEKAFYSIRKRKQLEKITVKELSETAMINKATFYLHYKDIFDLSEKLHEKLIEKIIEESLKNGLKNNIQSYKIFSENLICAFSKRAEEISVIFPEYSNEFITILEKKLKSAIFAILPEYRNNVDIDIKLSYIIYGSYYTLKNNNIPHAYLIPTMTNFSSKLLYE